jgi:hypothetical protein
MRTKTYAGDRRTARRVFSSWSIEVPASFVETFVLDPGYWHAQGEGGSISLTSFVVSDGERLVSSAELLAGIPDLDGSPVREMPPSLSGRAVIETATRPTGAPSVLQGILASEGRLLLVTITGGDLEWARHVWLSNRSYAAPGSRCH